ncbi:sodium:proton antiporter [Acetobacter persici]|uniref:cation:proton antiporter n=1 Tax=Acetobacter persici TaxID=1076596 RepID=UPI0020CE28FE|nr:sodium:proton antiporter [Acetobacter persici]MCP9318887.1 sodium:proton antiporter [Acetobacter persici]
MTSLGLFALVIGLASLFALLNERLLRLPLTIGILVFSLLAAALLLLAEAVLPGSGAAQARALLAQIDLPHTLLDGALAFLLFAGAQTVDVRALWGRRYSVLALAVLGTLLAVLLFAGGIWGVFGLLGFSISFPWCVVLGAILAPTDPVSVVGMLRRLGLPGPIQALFAGESLLNDGVGVVIFTVALSVAIDGGSAHASRLAEAFVWEVGGGLLVGLAGGGLALAALRAVRDHHVELLISLALASGVYSGAAAWGMSGPIAVVAAGLMLGAPVAQAALTPQGRVDLAGFWSHVDEILNALLFVIIGLQLVALSFALPVVAAACIALPLAVLVRGASVLLATLPLYVLRRERLGVLAVLTGGGLRGGISLALALSLPAGPERELLLCVSYSVVVFTILVQGMTIQPLVRKFYPVGQTGAEKG